MAYTHCTHRDSVRDWNWETMDFHTTQGHGEVMEPLFSILAIPFPVPVPILVPCSVSEPFQPGSALGFSPKH